MVGFIVKFLYNEEASPIAVIATFGASLAWITVVCDIASRVPLPSAAEEKPVVACDIYS
jgi:hypothetical protein